MTLEIIECFIGHMVLVFLGCAIFFGLVFGLIGLFSFSPKGVDVVINAIKRMKSK